MIRMKSSAELKGAYLHNQYRGTEEREQPLQGNVASTGVLRKENDRYRVTRPVQAYRRKQPLEDNGRGINDDSGEETVEEENGGDRRKIR